jgi:recombinational DNA repair protein RecT
MAQKTLLKRILKKYAPKSIETKFIDEAIAADQAVITDKGNQYVDNETIIETASEEMPTEKVKEQPTEEQPKQPQQQQEIPLPDAFKGL